MKKYTPYDFDEKVEYREYSQIGEEYRKRFLNKKIKGKDKDKENSSLDTYLEWKRYFIEKFSRRCDWNCNFLHYLKRRLRINERKVDLVKTVAVPIYISEFSCLMTIYQSNEMKIPIYVQIAMLFSAITVTVIATFCLIHMYSSRICFYTDCINIAENMDASN